MTENKPDEVVLEDDGDVNSIDASSFTPNEKNYLKERIGTDRYNKNVLYNKYINIECENIKKTLESIVYLCIYQMDKGKINVFEANEDLFNMFMDIVERFKKIKELFAKKSHMLY